MLRFLAVFLFALVAFPAAAYQSTGSTEGSLAAQAEKTKRERAARRAASGKSKSFTNDDLKGAGSAAVPSTTPDAGAVTVKDGGAGGASDKGGKSEDELRQKRAEIQQKIEAQRKRIEANQKAVADAQRELGDLTNYTLGGRRQALQKTVEDGNAEVAKGQQSIADLEEEARRLGASASR
jgi:hypothetical protein